MYSITFTSMFTCVLCVLLYFLNKININSILHVVSFSLRYNPESIQQVCRTFWLYFVVFRDRDKQFQVLNYLNISLQKNQQLYKHIFHRASIKALWRETRQQPDWPIRRLENQVNIPTGPWQNPEFTINKNDKDRHIIGSIFRSFLITDIGVLFEWLIK